MQSQNLQTPESNNFLLRAPIFLNDVNKVFTIFQNFQTI